VFYQKLSLLMFYFISKDDINLFSKDFFLLKFKLRKTEEKRESEIYLLIHYLK